MASNNNNPYATQTQSGRPPPAASQTRSAATIQNPYAKKPSSSTANAGGNNSSNTTGRSSSHSQSQPLASHNRQQQQQQQQQHPSNQTSAAAAKRNPSSGSSATALEAGTGSSFSQAFGGIEDTIFYRDSVEAAAHQQQQQQSQSQNNSTERSQQRAFDEEAAKLSDRDHHAFLQPHVLYISNKQRGNGVISYIRNVPYEYSRLVPDYVLNKTTCALFLSCKYHSLHPHYIHRRIAELKTDFRLRILLVLVDVEDNASTLLYLNKLAVQQNLTLILAWTEEEAARYLESYKALDGSDASLIQRKEKTNFVDQATEFLSGAQGVNKTDSASMLTQFSSIRAIMAASKDELGLVPGLGQVKVKRLHDAFHKPFSSKRSRERKKQKEEAEAQLEAQKERDTSALSLDCQKEEGKVEEESKDDAIVETLGETQAL